MQTLLALTLSGSVLALLLFLLKVTLGKRFSSTVYYYCWLIVLLRFLLPLPGLVPFGVPEREAQEDLRLQAMQKADIPEDNRTGLQDKESDYESFWLDTMGQEQTRQTAALQQKDADRGLHFSWKDPRLWLAVWATGAAVSLAGYAISYVRFSGKVRKDLTEPSESELLVYDRLSGRKPALRHCGIVKTPMMIGVLKPCILLPEGDYEPEVLRNILRHELMHFRRRDTLYKWFSVLVYSTQWFNPLAYVMRAEISRACELSCDEMLLRKMNTAGRQAYGETLLSMAASAALPAGIVATTFATEKNDLKERLVQIMNYRLTKSRFIASLLALVLLMSCAVFTGPRGYAEEGRASENVVEVSTVDEFLAGIAPNTTIVLKPGTYDFSTASGYGGPSDSSYWFWEDNYDGPQLVIEDVQDLTIRGAGADQVTISAVPRYANVIAFRLCTGITLENFTAGHTELPAFCAGNVLEFDSCTCVNISGCGLFGCGVLGIFAMNCKNITVTDTEIYDCTFGAVYLTSCRNVTFDRCTIRDHSSAQEDSVSYLFYMDSSDDVTIRNSVIRNNYAQSLLITGYTRNVVFAGNRVEDNSFLSSVFSSQLHNPVVEGCSFMNNSIFTWVDGNGVFPVDASGNRLGKQELESMAYREISPDEVLLPTSGSEQEIASVTPSDDGAYHVNTVDEFLAALGSERTIILEGDVFDLSTASDYGSPGNEYYRWNESYDGPELVIQNVHGLTISGANVSGANTALYHTFTAVPRYASVLAFRFCDNITLLNFTAGHTQEPGVCSGGVFSFQNCSMVYLGSTRMYGCGILGIDAYNCSSIVVSACEIFDCSQGGAFFYETSGIYFDDAYIHDVEGPALSFYSCSDVAWNNSPVDTSDSTYDVTASGDLTPYSWDSYNTEYVQAEEEIDPALALEYAKGELRQMQELGILNPDMAFDGDLEYSSFYNGGEGQNGNGRIINHGFIARDYSGKYLINFMIDDTVTGNVRSASFEAAADENDEVVRTLEVEGYEPFYYYDNFDDIFPADLTVGELCDRLAAYWGYTGWRFTEIYDPFYDMNMTAPSANLLVSQLPEDNYYACVLFDGDQEGVPMYIQICHLPGRVYFSFGETHAVG